jgi:K+-sensing histidine kinase KdpD
MSIHWDYRDKNGKEYFPADKNTIIIGGISCMHTILRNRYIVLSAASAMILLIGWADYISGWELGFFVFYFLPVSFSAWFMGKRGAVGIAIVSAATWFLADYILANHYSSHFYAFWNSVIRLISFVLIAVLVASIRRSLEYEKKVSADLQHSLNHIKRLHGMLPICASCKKIRNDKGYWEQIEQYISERSETEFTHGLCPECAMKLYPELMESIEKEKKGHQ